MNILELRAHLAEAGASPRDYSIGYDLDGRLMIMKTLGIWQVSFSERGECLDYKAFVDEGKACAYFLQQMDPTAFQPKIDQRLFKYSDPLGSM